MQRGVDTRHDSPSAPGRIFGVCVCVCGPDGVCDVDASFAVS